MDKLISLINIDLILSDPMLLTAVAFLAVGPLIFLFALGMFIAAGRRKRKEDFVIPTAESHPAEPEPEPQSTDTESTVNGDANGAIDEAPPLEEPAAKPAAQAARLEPEKAKPEPPQKAVKEDFQDKTVVMPSGVAEIQMQIEIAFTQIKSLNRQVHNLESEIETLMKKQTEKLDPHTLKEPPANSGELNEKLLKLAEHVIALEKEVEQLKAKNRNEGGQASGPKPEAPGVPLPSSKPPIMPL